MDLDRLSQLLANPDPNTRASAATAAADSGNAASIKPLAVRLRIEPEAKVRGVLLTALAKLGTPDGLAAIRAQAGDPDPANRCRVLEALFRAQDQQVFPLAVRLLSDIDQTVKATAFQVVRKLGKDGIMQIIGKMLAAEDDRWKIYAVAALGQIASAEGVAVLAKCLTHAKPEIRLQARASLVNLAKHGNDAAQKALAAHEQVAPAGDMNATLISTPLAAGARPPGLPEPPSGNNATLAVPPPGLRTAVGMQRPPSLGPSAAELAGPPPAATASTIAKRPPLPGAKPSFVPLDEDSMKIKPKVDALAKPPARKYSTAKYKALFGESMPRIVPPPPPPEPEPEPTEEEMPEEGDEPVEEAPKELTPEQEQERKKKSKHWKDNVCRDCVHVKKDRPDKQKMGQGRMWCSLVKKEVKSTHTCPRGKW